MISRVRNAALAASISEATMDEGTAPEGLRKTVVLADISIWIQVRVWCEDENSWRSQSVHRHLPVDGAMKSRLSLPTEPDREGRSHDIKEDLHTGAIVHVKLNQIARKPSP